MRGTDRKIGETIGESLRMDIREHIFLFVGNEGTLEKRVRDFVESTARHIPNAMEQLKGIARGAGIQEERIFALNLPPHAATAFTP